MNLGTLIADLYAHFIMRYGDAELASIATALSINQFLANRGIA
jgi:hypothetical protein